MAETGLYLRAGRIEDAEAGAALLRRSIIELCNADHRGDKEVIADWIANKTPEDWKSWLRNTDNILRVAIIDGCIVGVGMIDRTGMVRLNYVLPDARGSGVSRALMTWMEAEAVRMGHEVCRLESTITARDFYEARGFVYEGVNSRCLMMRKSLSEDQGA